MNETKPASRGVLSVITCASSSAPRIQRFVIQAQAAGWEVCVILTPQATKFVERAMLARLTGHPVRSEDKRPEELDVLPRVDAVVALPVTFNTLNKWVPGITDPLAPG